MSTGPVQAEIERRIVETFRPLHLELDNESHMHSVPRGSETHFRLVLVSAKFEGLSRIQRQRLVNEALVDFLKPGGVHALTQKAMTAAEWEAAGGEAGLVSPNCHSKK